MHINQSTSYDCLLVVVGACSPFENIVSIPFSRHGLFFPAVFLLDALFVIQTVSSFAVLVHRFLLLRFSSIWRERETRAKVSLFTVFLL